MNKPTIMQRVKGTMACVVRRFQPTAWREHELISPDGLIYTVRDAPGREREIKHNRRGTWTPESQTQFSLIPTYETYHRQQYQSAKPYPSNPEAMPPSSGGRKA